MNYVVLLTLLWCLCVPLDCLGQRSLHQFAIWKISSGTYSTNHATTFGASGGNDRWPPLAIRGKSAGRSYIGSLHLDRFASSTLLLLGCNGCNQINHLRFLSKVESRNFEKFKMFNSDTYPPNKIRQIWHPEGQRHRNCEKANCGGMVQIG